MKATAYTPKMEAFKRAVFGSLCAIYFGAMLWASVSWAAMF